MRFFRWLSWIFFVIILSGCLPQHDNPTSVSDITHSEETMVYTDEEISKITDFAGSLEELTSHYITNYLHENKLGHCVIYRGETKIAILFFDTEGEKITSYVQTPVVSKEAFSSLSVGNTLEEVRTIDPGGDYPFLYAGRNDVPAISMHYTTDGYCITIEYDEYHVIESIKIESILE